MKLEPWGTSGSRASGSQLTLIALKTPSVPGPPWIGIRLPPRVSYWNSRRVPSSGIPAPARSVTASAERLADQRVVGVEPARRVAPGRRGRTGRRRSPPSPGRSRSRRRSAATAKLPSRREAKRRKRIAPAESRSSRTSQAASTGQAPLTSTGPGASPATVGFCSQNATSSSRQSSPAYWRLPSATLASLRSVEALAAQPVGAGEALLDHHQAEPRAQRPRRRLVADHPGEPGQRLLGVGEPVAVVAVLDVVAADQARDRRRPEDPGDDRVGVGVPAARRARAVEDRDPGEREDGEPERARAAGRLGVGHVRDRAVHRVVGAALAVGGDAVHPRDALDLALDPVVRAHRPRPVGREEVVEVAEVLVVDVAERVAA